MTSEIPPAFQPDSELVSRIVAAENREDRRGCSAPNILILHYTGMESAEAAIRWLALRESGVSCHYVVDETGAITQLVPEGSRAWHAGLSMWEGRDDVNSRSIGIEIHNPGHGLGYPDFPRAQMLAVEKLCHDIVSRNKIAPRHVLAHSDIAPARKDDPGEKFNWAWLALGGIGHWVEPAPIVEGDALDTGSCGAAVRELQKKLAAYGYGIDVTGAYDDATRIVVRAFQRHFRPALVDGRADPSTLKTLDALLEALPETDARSF
ncbi:N-acetylmuramyl-L-alanine amidase, negative regulator of AmpC, AmpD [Rhodomicrobium vannielii ATCC 17100]|uniref:N-acetylmuramoyl-L-alanine amidase n=1 Tax=Rhodomicrobium vannielii (strain ATCC 17100 / DSM 162 / LMG 4299 / NCIMB 10020 / ATH 3.1.1) TaxID=648757 RepID=E3HYX6_RHOVT|nr:N-acetylmuramoyl-L-alanine amidase [Rhodomicrobium vannielii]ADP70951.1 N-acetylmuramyl-L-alanine amidase, negative regulator of AmpC, AmpD [Rhodomicrobium vannielii ATCC 17100]